MSDHHRLRLLALDVDGTVLGSDKRVSPATRQAVGAVAESEAEVVLASSRGPNGLRPLFSQLARAGCPSLTRAHTLVQTAPFGL